MWTVPFGSDEVPSYHPQLRCSGCEPPALNERVVLRDIHDNSFIGKRVQHEVFGEMYQHQNTLIPPNEIKEWIHLP